MMQKYVLKYVLNVHFYTPKVRTLCIQKYTLLHLQRQRLKYEGVRKGCPHFFCKSPNFRKLGLFY